MHEKTLKSYAPFTGYHVTLGPNHIVWYPKGFGSLRRCKCHPTCRVTSRTNEVLMKRGWGGWTK